MDTVMAACVCQSFHCNLTTCKVDTSLRGTTDTFKPSKDIWKVVLGLNNSLKWEFRCWIWQQKSCLFTLSIKLLIAIKNRFKNIIFILVWRLRVDKRLETDLEQMCVHFLQIQLVNYPGEGEVLDISLSGEVRPGPSNPDPVKDKKLSDFWYPV